MAVFENAAYTLDKSTYIFIQNSNNRQNFKKLTDRIFHYKAVLSEIHPVRPVGTKQTRLRKIENYLLSKHHPSRDATQSMLVTCPGTRKCPVWVIWAPLPITATILVMEFIKVSRWVFQTVGGVFGTPCCHRGVWSSLLISEEFIKVSM